MKIFNKLLTAVFCMGALASCQKGLVYEDVPESIYNNVDLAANYCDVQSRELFTDKIYVVNHESWGPQYPQYVDNYISTVTIGNYQGVGKDYTNKTTSAVTIPGQTIQPGETVLVKNSIQVVDEASAPEGKLYIVNLFADATATYKTYNKGYKFELSKFAGAPVQPEMVDPDAQGRSEQIKLPVRPTEIIVAMILAEPVACYVTPMDGAPELGKPGDFSAPRRYLVTNSSRRPDGEPAKQRLYEIRVTFLP